MDFFKIDPVCCVDKVCLCFLFVTLSKIQRICLNLFTGALSLSNKSEVHLGSKGYVKSVERKAVPREIAHTKWSSAEISGTKGPILTKKSLKRQTQNEELQNEHKDREEKYNQPEENVAKI